MNFIESVIQNYIEENTTPEPELIRELVQASREELEYTDMLSGLQVGRLLHMLVKIGRCKRVLEVGTFTGYSALWMADALPDDGQLMTIELNERYRKLSNRYFSRQPYSHKISQVMGDALQVIDTLQGKFDLVFLDADKVYYPQYFQKLKKKLNYGGIFVADNVLWSGKVVQPDDEKSRAIDAMNRMIQNDPGFMNLMLPVRDGLTIALLNEG